MAATPNQDSELLKIVGVGGSIPSSTEGLYGLREKALVRETEAEKGLKEAQQKAALKEQAGKRELFAAEAEAKKPMEEKLMAMEKDRPYPPPTKDNFKEFSSMFSIISALTFAVGGKGRGSGMAALSALNGAIEGYNKGRKDLFDMNMKEFDKKLAEYKTSLESTREALKIISDRASLKSKEGIAALAEARLNDQGIAAAELEKGNIVRAIKHIDNLISKVNQREIQNNSFKHQEDMKNLALGYGRGASALVEQNLGTQLPTKEAETVALAAKAMGEAKQLSDEVAKDPSIVGRTGQVRQFFDRYVASWMNYEKNPTKENYKEFTDSAKELSNSDQKALIFAKRYSAFLVTYERGLAGGARGFTVFFQQRFNQLMSQDQFNAEGFRMLMDDMRRESATSAASITPAATFDKMQAMGDDIARRGSVSSPTAPTTLSGAPQKGVDINAERQRAQQAIQGGKDPEAVKRRFKERTGQDL